MGDSVSTLSGPPEAMRVEEERLLREGFERVPPLTPDAQLKAMQYKWHEPAPITSLFKQTVVLSWRKA